MKDIELIIRKVDGKVTLRVINLTDKRFADYTEKDIAKSKNIKECCEVLLEGFSSAITEIETEIKHPSKIKP